MNSKRLSKLSPERLALLELLLQEEGVDAAPTPTIPRRTAADRYPLSFAQERLWFLDQLQPNNSAYNLPAALRLIGPLDLAALARSLNAITQRHEILRTTFVMEDGGPVQLIAPDQTMPLPLVDLRNLPEAEREAELLRLLDAEAALPFDLARGPLARAALLRLSADTNVLLLTLHHIIADGWSVGVFTRELSALYAGFAAGHLATLPELPIQYADYAIWQRAWLQGEILETQLAYWRAQLADLPQLDLPTDHPHPDSPSSQGAVYEFALPAALNAELEALSRREGATLFMTILAAWQTLLARYCRQEQIVIGTTIAGRTLRETEGLIGFFINTLVLRADLADNPTFRELIGRVRKVALDAYAHQDLPFEQLVDALQPVRTSSRHPLFQVMFGLQNAPAGALELPDLAVHPLEAEHRTAKIDLGLSITQTQAELWGTLTYRTTLFDAPTIMRIAGYVRTLLTAIAADADQHLNELPLLSAAEQQQVFVEWNDTKSGVRGQLSGRFANRPYGVGSFTADASCLHELFEAQAMRTPDAIALIYETNDEGRKTNGVDSSFSVQRSAFSVQLTYHELNARANQLARQLRALGAGPEVRVGCYLERSLNLAVALLGILKAGAAYVPIEPTYPAARVAFMLADSKPIALLTQQRLAAQLPTHDARVICLDSDWATIMQQDSANEAGTARAENLAYLIYTSGTTGQPKAVMVEHRHVINTLYAGRAIYRFSARDRVPCLLSFSFDIALFEFMSPLVVGGSAILVPEQHVLNPVRLIALLAEITFLHGPPSLLRQIVSFVQTTPRRAGYDRLRQIAVGGDVIPPELLHDLQRVFAAQIYVGYGPTEGTIMCTNCAVERDKVAHRHVIGRPMQNMQVHIYDSRHRLLPIGVPGELFIGGAGVARGYLNRPELTAERFVPNSFAGDKETRRPGDKEREQSSIGYRLSAIGYRLYRTGDLARWLPDGMLEFLGRIDDQVKVRGYRIELGEIEVALCSHPAVREGVVAAQQDGSGDQRLVAYVVPQPMQSPTVSELRLFLQTRLPDYMLPAVFVFLAALPLTSNSKVDRQALPAPEQVRPALEKGYVAPRTELEQLLADMWQASLGLDAIGINDNFFELGGNSIQAALFINKLQEKSGEVVYVVAVFDAPTVGELAAYLAKHYPQVVAKLCRTPVPDQREDARDIRSQEQLERVNHAMVARLRQLMPGLPPRIDHAASVKNRPALFILSPPRSGSTLLRVMLAGHPHLFAPPGLELLSFNTLRERRDAFSGRNRFWLEGTVRAIMEIKGCDTLTAERIMAECEDQDLTIQQFYRLMQEWIGERLLVDKSRAYTLDPATLRRAELDFEQPRYIHLLRHPYGMIRSFEESNIEQVFFQYEHPFAARTFAELLWLVGQQNIVEFLGTIPQQRQHRIIFEELVARPQQTMEQLCQFLGLAFHPDMLEPYKDPKQRMTDGIHAFSKMVGDVKFHQHRAIDPTVGERWKQHHTEDFLGEITWQMAEALGYARAEHARPATPRLALAPIRQLARDGSVALQLSFAQQRLWFFDQLQPNSPTYNIPTAVDLLGQLDLRALQHSLSTIMQRHEILRTTFPTMGGQPVQAIAPARTLRLPLLDLRALPRAEQRAEAQRLAQLEAHLPYDLARGPLLRIHMLRLCDDEHVVLLNMHHIISDAWSMSVFIAELAALYAAGMAATPAALPELPIQYADYAAWQRAWLKDELLESQLAYWRRQLASMPVLRLPTDHPRSPVATLRGAHRDLMLPARLSQELELLSRRASVTPFMTLLAAWQTLLARYSGQNDIMVGTPISGRTRAETERLIGFFLNTLVLRADLSGSPSFRALLARVREMCLGAYAHQDVPFEQVVEALQPMRDLSRHPLFQVLFAFQNAPTAAIELSELRLLPIATELRTTHFDLSLSLMQSEAGLSGMLEYSTDLFEAPTIMRLLRHFQALLEAIIRDPAQDIAALPILTPAERQQLLVEWNATSRGVRGQGSGVRGQGSGIRDQGSGVSSTVPDSACLHQLFEAQVARTPDAVAVLYETKDERRTTNGADSSFVLRPSSFVVHVTYAELDRRANQLAHYLRTMGVGPETPVAVCLERSLELMIGVLGTLKAGAVCLPLDPAYPSARLAFMLADAQVSVLIAGQSIYDLRLTIDDLGPPDTPIVNRKSKIVNLDADWPLIARQPATNPDSGVMAGHLAYAIYTSGSTGQPKGVLIAHEALVNYTLAVAAEFGLHAGDRVLQFASPGFDVLVEELFPTWICGGAVVLHGAGLLAPAAEFGRLIEQTQITAMELPAAYWHAWVDDLIRSGSGVPAALRLMLLGCEKPSPDRVLAWQQFGIPLIYVFGLTETTITSTLYRTAPALITGPGAAELPIGRPIANTQLYVLSPQLQPLPIGVPGELYIGGAGLARGYLNRPELTAERFVPNPFAPLTPAAAAAPPLPRTGEGAGGEGMRLYRTGDLARYRPDGMLDFLGRIDTQVKLRGFRVELGEIESVLRAHPIVRECAVAVREEQPGDTRLVAYVVPAETLNDERRAMNGPEWSSSAFSVQRSALAGELRDFLQQRLPDYMVPAAFVVLDTLPLTPSGKVDRQALPPPDPTQRSQEHTPIAPRTVIEALLAQAWAEVLRVAQVGIHDSFFALGGHSLLAAQVIARVREMFQAELPLRSLFEFPTVAGLANQIEAARRSTRVLLAPPQRVPRDTPLPMSFAQQRLWFIDQLRPNSFTYNIPSAIQLTGQLDLAALARGLNEVVRRHEVMRTTFATVAGAPVQIIAPALALALPVLDLGALAADARETALRRLAVAEAEYPFDLARGPLLRATLLRLGSQDHVALLTMHHIISDAWSMEVLVREITALYAAYISGQPSPLPALPIQYADYAVWQRELLSGAVLDEQLAYWRRSLANLPALELPTDHPRPAVANFQGASQDFSLAPALSAGLIALSGAEGVTLFMALLAVFQVFLARYCDQDDIVVGTPIANRSQIESAGLIGFFLNTLVLRTNLGGAATFREVLRRVRAVCLSAYDHQDLPFEQVVEALQPERDLGRHPLFQVVCTLEHAPIDTLVLPDLTVRPLAVETTTARFDLTLSLVQIGAGLTGMLVYRTDLFEVATITRMRSQFQTLLAGITAAPGDRLADLPLLSRAERQQLLVEWNDTTVGVRSRGGLRTARTEGSRIADVCLHELFAQQAARAPDAIALVFGFRDKETSRPGDKELTRDQGSGIRDQDSRVPTPDPRPLNPDPCCLTYRELDRRANQLAHHLRQLGVRPEVPVAVCLERSLDLVVGLLGVLQAGGAYVPLDPSYPAERLAFMLADAGARVLITHQSIYDLRLTIDDLGSPDSPIVNRKSKIVNLNADWPMIAQQPETHLASAVTADQLAYAIYTSGSTGQPKGIAVSHRNVVRLVQSSHYANLNAADVLLQLAPISFDAATFEIWGSLLNGARLVIFPAHMPSLPELGRLLVAARVTTLWLTAGLFHQMVEDQLDALRDIRQLLAGGDVLSVAHVRQLLAVLKGGRLINGYGPTENTTFTCCHPMWTAAQVGASVAIGRPITNTQVYILDRRLAPVPIGVPGELYAGGDGIARAYLNRPDLTAERFVPNPFATLNAKRETLNEQSVQRSAFSVQRLYRTGDRARYLPDGTIEFLGRLDDQVKLRGFRVEPGEVATALLQHPAVRECVVVMQAAAPGQQRLVAYVVPQDTDKETRRPGDTEETADSSFVLRRSSFVPDLRAFLQQRLPDYMVPSAFVALDALPLTTNGKIDRRALPPPDTARLVREDTFVVPRTPTEALLATIWADLLGLDQVGINDNFFELGGHSLLATQVISRIREIFRIELPLRYLFESPTVAELAERVAAAERQGAMLHAPPLQPVPRDAPLPLSFAQQRLWFLEQLQLGRPIYNLSSAVRLLGPLDVTALAQGLNAVVQRHESLRTTFATVDGQPVQLIAPARTLPLPLLDLRALPGDRRADVALKLATNAARHPFDLGRGPLLRLALVRLAPGEHVLLLNLHHIIADGWSVGLFIGEFSACYTAAATGRTAALPELPIQYADYAVWQRAWLQSAVLAEQLAYWKGQLANLPLLELPIDHPRPTLPTFQGAYHRFVLASALNEELAALSRREGVTLFMALLAAFQLLLARSSGQHDIVVGTPIANRTRGETERLIGCFVNTLVLRADLAGTPSFREVLRRVREVCLGAYAHQDVPFEQLVEALQPERTLSHHPLFQVMFTLQNMPSASLELPDLTLEPLAITEGLVQFDFSLSLSETDAGLIGTLTYATDLFTATTIMRMARHFQTLIAGLVARPELPSASLPLLTEPERQQVLVDWNDTVARIRGQASGVGSQGSGVRGQGSGVRSTVADSACLHDLVAAQAERTPDAIALVFGLQDKETRRQADKETTGPTTNDGSVFSLQSPRGYPAFSLQMTYRALDTRANQLAHDLQGFNVGPEMRVGLCLERSLDLIVALLAILKAGAAYVPIDPDYPSERQAFMIADAQLSALITRAPLAARLSDQITSDQPLIICLDSDAARIAQQDSLPPPRIARAENLAYLIYTSGTTGRPKAVMVEHRHIVNTLYATQTRFNLGPGERMLCLASIAFDIALFECLSPLVLGGTTFLLTQQQALDLPLLMTLLRQITFLHMLPSLMRQLVRALQERGDPTPAPHLRGILVGGDAIPNDLVAHMQQLFPQAQLYLGYGPTEGTIICTANPVLPRSPVAGSWIGAPLPNMQVRLYDQRGQLVPIGIAGEITIGGAGVARGYHNRPDLTAERFVPNPFAEVSGAGYRVSEDELPDTRYPTPATRLYKTGDRARYLPDGTIEFLGRIDEQVKVRGYRIEPGEIETILRQHPAVHEAVVAARLDSSREQRLVAYIVPAPGGTPTVGDLRRSLQAVLPDYMIPAAFVFLGSLPLTATAKIDRAALPDPAGPHVAPDADAAPRTALEQFLAHQWQELLGIDAIGIHQNFFELGGNSIQALLFVNKLQDELREIVHVVTIFDAPTLAELAAYLGERYPQAVARIWGAASAHPAATAASEGSQRNDRIDAASVAQLRQLIVPLPPRRSAAQPNAAKNKPAIFILSPPRSGSTLLRVLLAGNPQLFAPPELELLSFNTLAERRAAFSGRNRAWLEGAIRAVMELQDCDPVAAERMIAAYEDQDMPVQQFYQLLQSWLDDRILVDKTPSYALDRAVLDRAEADFTDARYIHLLRHPYGMIRSFEEAQIDQVFFRYPHPFSTRVLAELIWLISQQNIRAFLAQIPAARRHCIRFEDLVRDPQATLVELCDFLGVAFHPDMLQPYGDTKRKMTDGIHPFSKMLGDVKFHTHQTINAAAADQWQTAYTNDFLGDLTWQMAEELNYARPAPDSSALAPTRSTLTPIRAIPHDGTPLPLSFAQQRLWFVDQLQPNSPAYTMPTALRLSGALDLAALHQSLHAIMQRHAILRTIFVTVDGQPQQLVTPADPLALPLLDLQALPPAPREAIARHLAHTDARAPFDLARGPLLRLTLLRLATDVHIVLVSMHHIVADAWSMSIFTDEIVALYAAARQGQLAPLAPLPIQYADYAVWQREWLRGEGDHALSPLQAQLAYWRDSLADLPVLELPTDEPRPPTPSFHGASQEIVLPPTLSAELIALSRAEGATLFMTLLAAFQLLLARYSQQDDVVVGTDIANRTRAETERLIGFFVNQLVLRSDLSGNPTFRMLLRRVRAVTLGAFAHQDMPFEQLVAALQPERHLNRTPLFQVKFLLQNAPAATLALPDLAIQPLEIATTTAQFDLTLSLAESGGELAGMLIYRTDLFATTTITRMRHQFQVLLTSIVAAPNRRLADLQLLSPAEQQQVLVEWNDTRSGVRGQGSGVGSQGSGVRGQGSGVRGQGSGVGSFTADASCLHELFAAQAERTPDAVALVFDRDQGSGVRDQESPAFSLQPSAFSLQMTYRELNERVNQLAHYLRRMGVGPEVLVATCLERSLELVVGLLGVLKAGGAYVPLDPSYPAERLAFMLEDSGAALLLTQEHLLSDLATHWLPVICLDADWPAIAQSPIEPPSRAAQPDQLAYLIYTSGSTGTPKGVEVTHRGLLNLAAAQARAFAVQSASRVLQFASLSFDAAVWEICMALPVGAALVLAARDDLLPGPPLRRLLHAQAITHVTLPPSALAALPDTELTTLQTIIAAGEACPSAVVQRWARRSRFWNAYGPTEATVCATMQACQPEQHSPAIGRPLPNTQSYVLDVGLGPVPIGVVGELHLGGVGLARGYRQRPDLTAERFVPNPFAGDKETRRQGDKETPQSAICNLQSAIGTRLYKTGDRARYRPDGNIEYLGRHDQQVKLRGYRIELGEIAAALARHQSVREVLVLIREDALGGKQLVAYVVPTKDERRKTKEEERDPSFVLRPSSFVSELRAFLKERLPDYMIPAAFMLLERWPLTPNGKIDRAALPAPARSPDVPLATYTAPRDLLELQLMQLWEAVLGVQPISLDANFFELGGHSLAAVGLLARIQQQFGRELPVAALFHAPTIEQLACLLREHSEPPLAGPLVALQPRGSQPPFFLVHPIGGTALCYVELAAQLDVEQPCYGLHARGLDGDQEPYACIEDMAAHYINALRDVQPQGPYQLGGWSMGGLIAFEMAQQLHRQGEIVRLLALLDTQAPLNHGTVEIADLTDAEIIIMALGREALPMSREAFQQLAPDEQLTRALTWARQANILPPDAGLVQIGRLIRVFRANTLAVANYLPQIYPNSVTLFKSEAQLEDPSDPTPATDSHEADWGLGWSALSTQPVTVEIVPGTHATMVSAPHVQVLAERLRTYLHAL